MGFIADEIQTRVGNLNDANRGIKMEASGSPRASPSKCKILWPKNLAKRDFSDRWPESEESKQSRIWEAIVAASAQG